MDSNSEKPEKKDLEYFIGQSNLLLSDIAHVYLLISRKIHGYLKKYSPDYDELLNHHDELLELIEKIHQKGTLVSDNKDKNKQDRKSIFENRNYVMRCMEFYVTEMQYLREYKHKKIITFISCMAILISFGSLAVTIISLVYK